jgi:hypothetical protein
VWIWWVLGGLLIWLAVALGLGILIGRGIRLADERAGATADVVLTGNVVAGAAAAQRQARRAIPLPPIGMALAALAVALEAGGYLARLRGVHLTAISMDAPFSVPRLYVATLFAFAALVALAGTAAHPGRRTWWTAVAVVGAAIATIKAGGTVHERALNALDAAVGDTAAQLISAGLALAVIGALWYLSRTERRDRRRVLGSLAGYAVAAVGLSEVSTLVGASSWAATATFVEESCEALGAVAFLIAVLAGVVPRAVLPAGWPLRRAADAGTVELTERLRPGGGIAR